MLLPTTKSWAQLAKEFGGNSRVGKAMDDIIARNPGTRASMDGQVSSKLTYEGWFKGLTQTRQEEILGPGRYELWKNDGLTMRQMLDQSGNPLTLDELRAKVGR